MVDLIKASIINDLTELEDDGTGTRSRTRSAVGLPPKSGQHSLVEEITTVRARSCSWGGPALDFQPQGVKSPQKARVLESKASEEAVRYSKLDKWYAKVKKKARRSKDKQDHKNFTLRLSSSKGALTGINRRSVELDEGVSEKLSPRSLLRKMSPRTVSKVMRVESKDGTTQMINPLFGRKQDLNMMNKRHTVKKRMAALAHTGSMEKITAMRPQKASSDEFLTKRKLKGDLRKCASQDHSIDLRTAAENYQASSSGSSGGSMISNSAASSTRRRRSLSGTRRSSSPSSSPKISRPSRPSRLSRSDADDRPRHCASTNSIDPASSFVSSSPKLARVKHPNRSAPSIPRVRTAQPPQKRRIAPKLKDLASSLPSNFIVSMPQLFPPTNIPTPQLHVKNVNQLKHRKRLNSIERKLSTDLIVSTGPVIRKSQSEPQLTSWEYMDINQGYDVLLAEEYQDIIENEDEVYVGFLQDAIDTWTESSTGSVGDISIEEELFVDEDAFKEDPPQPPAVPPRQKKKKHPKQSSHSTKARSHEMLISKLLSSPSPKFVDSFLLTYNHLFSASTLFSRLMNRFCMTNPSEESTAEIQNFRVLNICKKWIKNYFDQFENDPTALNEIVEFFENLTHCSEQDMAELGRNLTDLVKYQVSNQNPLRTNGQVLPLHWIVSSLALIIEGATEDPAAHFEKEDAVGWISLYFGVPDRSEVERIFNLLVNRKLILETACGYLINPSEDSPEPLVPQQRLHQHEYEFMTLHPLEIARQLTLIHEHLFHCITASDMVRQMKHKKVNHIDAEVDFSNRVAQWVATEIVTTPNLKKRVLVLQRFVFIAEYCRRLNNYGTMMNLVLGLNMPSVTRLKKTFQALPKKYIRLYEELSELCSVVHNFRRLRESLKCLHPPLIPYFALYLKDATLINEGNPNTLPDGSVNWNKCKLLSACYREIRTLQTYNYSLQHLPSLQNYLMNMSVLTTDELYRSALQIEPAVRQLT